MELPVRRLFDTLIDSPICAGNYTWNDDELQQDITPYNKARNLAAKRSTKDINVKIDFPKCLFEDRSSNDLFLCKIQSDLMTDSYKRQKSEQSLQDSPQTTSKNVIRAVDKLTSQGQLVADGSRDYTLPTIPGKHSDLRSISADTMADVVNGKYDDTFGKVTIVDCRYPYEFDGGHIRGAVNLYTKDAVLSLLEHPVMSDKPHVLIFHCEFSSERGPKMHRFLRSRDRELNKDRYPQLNFPEVYLLDGGYKAFFITQQTFCEPMNYKPMLHEDHTADLRHFRVKSKSWTAGETQQISRRTKTRRPTQSLEF